MKHTLLNPDSRHYDNGTDKPDIYKLEECLTVAELIGWCNGNICKYSLRKHKKGQKESDEKKIKTYKAYKKFLQKIDEKDRHKHGRLAIDNHYQNLEYWL
jgi:hypothetical protein